VLVTGIPQPFDGKFIKTGTLGKFFPQNTEKYLRVVECTEPLLSVEEKLRRLINKKPFDDILEMPQ
jgi:hypothetical protein